MTTTTTKLEAKAAALLAKEGATLSGAIEVTYDLLDDGMAEVGRRSVYAVEADGEPAARWTLADLRGFVAFSETCRPAAGRAA